MNHWTTKERTYHTFLLMQSLEPERISYRIREARREAGFTQESLADLLGVHKRTVENWENVRVPWNSLNDLAGVFNRPITWFLWGEDEDEITTDLQEAAARIEAAVAEFAQEAKVMTETLQELHPLVEQLQELAARQSHRNGT